MATKFIPAHSVRYSKFLGMNKAVSENPASMTEEGAVWLSATDNVDITRASSVKRRDGYSLAFSGNFSSLWGNGSVVYAVESGNLVELTNGSVVSLRESVGTTKMSFVDALNGDVYFTNGGVIGKVRNGVALSLTRGTDEFKDVLPPGQMLAYLPPRVIVAKGNVLYFSDAINRDVYHLVYGFMMFESTIRMVGVVGSSLYVSDEKFTYFFQRTGGAIDIPVPQFKMKMVLDYPAVRSTNVERLVGVNKMPEAIAWVSERGICLAGEEGIVENVTEFRLPFETPPSEGHVVFRSKPDINLLISTVR